MSRTTDTDLAADMINKVAAGRRIIGAIGAPGALELVLDGPPPNLITVAQVGGRTEYTIGFVCREWVDDGYGRPEVAAS
jgi:hypothetical protein